MKASYTRKPTGKFSVRVFINQTPYCMISYPDHISLRKEGTALQYHIAGGTCTCPAFKNYSGDCKHLLSLRKLLSNLNLSLSVKQILEKSE